MSGIPGQIRYEHQMSCALGEPHQAPIFNIGRVLLRSPSEILSSQWWQRQDPAGAQERRRQITTSRILDLSRIVAGFCNETAAFFKD
ncbi:hypothetical protein CIHG_05509 [Coccidioides immitis H538.4]|uniref:Uncharacterized protein n=1 Tax=Coccidioides immitis H538.4 TaxID=396776 RepID=A0A0J8RUL9_COCIT|nr:hypothetical protein CIHG_05509 [Coccidioides immitis H538.4]